MTEDEAKTKWCPHARDSETAGNRSFMLPADIRFPCLASACMAWRESAERIIKASRNPLVPNKVEKHGYCGLAGAPQ